MCVFHTQFRISGFFCLFVFVRMRITFNFFNKIQFYSLFSRNIVLDINWVSRISFNLSWEYRVL